MSHEPNGRVELTTERLLLRPFEVGDVDDVLAYASDPEVARYLELPQPYTRDDAEEYIARRILDDWSNEANFAIVWEQRVVGSIGLHINVRDEMAALGYALARPVWGLGIVPEAGRAVIDWGFERYSLHRIHSRADLRNRQSWRVMEKLGMTREGVLRGHRRMRNEHVDDVCYGILREEWKQARDDSA